MVRSHRVTTVVSLIACLVLLFGAMRRKSMADDNSTGHVFDENLTELNNPMPMWWMVLFVLTVVFALIYVYVFPALGSAAGSLGWSSTGEHDADKAKAGVEMAKVYAAYRDMPAETLSKDPRAMAIGQRLFINNCATCHGSDARGSKGFPDLTDRDWLHGGTPAKIEGDDHPRPDRLDAADGDGVGSAQDVSNVAHYVLSLSAARTTRSRLPAGKVEVHGMRGLPRRRRQGQPALGAPNLADKVWLHGWGEDGDRRHRQPRQDQRDAGAERRLLPEQIHLLATYVWSLSQPRELAAK
jgi:cytochrome c oxidase cbb3-type subunit 3